MSRPGVIRRVQADGGALSCAGDTQNSRHHLVQRHRCPDFVPGHPAQERLNVPDVLKDHPSSVSTALYPRAASARTTLDFPVPDIPVSRTRFTEAAYEPVFSFW